MTRSEKFVSLIISSVKAQTVKKLVFSRPVGDGSVKISGRLCAHRGRRLLSLEYTKNQGAVSQENIGEEKLEARLSELISQYKQVNLITTLGDAEYKVSKKGKDVIIGGDAIERRLSGGAPTFEAAIEALDRKKDYILSGEEDFLIELGISDKNGRVHDKKQGKFRQINRFLEHIEDLYPTLPAGEELVIYDFCCGKSYLSFAVYYYLTKVKARSVRLLGIDLKKDVIEWCSSLAAKLSYTKMQFFCDDIKNTPEGERVDMVISLHACDIATDIVINRAIELGAKIILSTPCCHRYMNGKVKAESLSFVTRYPHLSNKLCEALTDAIRAKRLEAAGYSVSALELTDPENTPKNKLIRAISVKKSESELKAARAEYEQILNFLLLDAAKDYLKEIKG